MKKYFLTCCYYPNNSDTYNNFYKYHVPRIKLYCDLHGYKHIDANWEKYNLPSIFKQIAPNSRTNTQFARWYIINDAIKKNVLKEGDIVNYIDSDIFIAQPKKPLITNKSFTYAIDSGNTHCTGVFSLKINSFTRKLIDCILSQERFDILTKYPVYTEADTPGTYKNEIFYMNDQHAYYHAVGITPHSWTSYFDTPNYGFHTMKSDYIAIPLQEILDNVEILGPEWNTTHLVEETGVNGVPYMYDIVRTTKDKVINRHFAGGQTWRTAEWYEYSKQY